MKKTFTILIAAIAAIMLITQPLKVVGQTRDYQKVYTLTPQSSSAAGSSDYSTAIDFTIDYKTWSVMGNTQNTPWNIGGKNITSVNRPIYSKTAIDDNISRIAIYHGNKDSDLTVNSMTVTVHTSAYDAAAGTNAIASFAPTFKANDSIIVVKSDATSWAGKFYRIVYNVTYNQNNGNKKFQFTKAILYKTVSTTPSISIDDQTFAATAGSGTIDITSSNITPGPSSAINLYSDEECTIPFSAGWFTANFKTDDKSTDYSKISYTISENSGTPYAERNVYMKVTLNDAAKTSVTSDPVTITQKRYYTVTFNGNGGATAGSATTYTQNISDGATATLTANQFSRSGYRFLKWNTKSDYSGSDINDEAEFTISKDSTLYAKWGQLYGITISPSSNGTVVAKIGDDAVSTAAAGDNITLTITPDDGYTLNSLAVKDSGDNNVTVTNNAFTMPASAVTINATFREADIYKLFSGTIVEGDYVIYYDGNALKNTQSGNTYLNTQGSITPVSNQIADPDASIIWHIAPSSNYWTLYNASATKYAASTGNASGAQLLDSGTDDKSLWTVTGTSTYEFVNKKNTSSSVNANLRYNSSSPRWACYSTSTGGALSLYKKTVNSDVSVAAVDNGTITATPAGGDAITEGNSVTVTNGTAVTLAATPASGYKLMAWDVYKTDATSTKVTVKNNTFTMPDYAVTVSATFEQSFTITISDAIVNGTVESDLETAAEGETVTLTAAPASGYRLGAFTITKDGGDAIDEGDIIVDGNNAMFDMPADNVTVTATFIKIYTVIYNKNGGTGTMTDPDSPYDTGDDVLVLDNEFTAPTGKLFKNWYTKSTEDGTGTAYDPSDIIEGISSDITLYAIWRDIVYHVTYNVNGDESETEDVDYNESTTYQPSLSPLSFIGWSLTENGETVGKTYKPTGETENIKLYAVFGAIESDVLTINLSTSGITSTSYVSGSFTTNSKSISYSNICKQTSGSDAFLQFKGSAGTVYNSDNNSLGNITSIVINYYSGTENYGLSVKGGTSKNPSSGTAIASSGDGNVRTFNFSDYSFDYFGIYCAGYSRVTSIVVYYDETSPVVITPISGEETIDENITDSDYIVVSNGGILTLEANNTGSASNLIIEDGGQLICANSVPATMKKNISAASDSKDVSGWNAIASAVHDSGKTYETISSGTNLTTGTYDMFYYDEESCLWMNYKDGEGNPVFDTLQQSRGYIYRNAAAMAITYAGNTNTGTINQYVLSCASENNDLKGFNLIGNPYPHKIYKGVAFATTSGTETDTLTTGYYLLESDGSWTSKTNAVAIDVNQAVLVKATTYANGKTLVFKDKTEAPALSKSHNDNIMFTVKNAEHSDVTYALFDKGIGLNKINHRNPDIPMLYISQDGDDFAIATMSDDTKMFSLNLKAKTMGKYTISYKADGNFSYLHLIDRLTGDDVDLLLDNEYAFMASPTDNPARFIVRLEYSENPENIVNSVFAYQNGNDIIVSGEGELQIFDLMGRMVAKQYINGVETCHGASLQTGVYIFRLNENVQKIVVK